MTRQKDIEGNESKRLLQSADFANKRVLEIGCGEGRLTWRYAKKTSRTFGVDPDLNALRVATMDMPSNLRERVSLVCASSIRLPYKKESFDIALLSWSL